MADWIERKKTYLYHAKELEWLTPGMRFAAESIRELVDEVEREKRWYLRDTEKLLLERDTARQYAAQWRSEYYDNMSVGMSPLDRFPWEIEDDKRTD